jgi:hypothetical protein
MSVKQEKFPAYHVSVQKVSFTKIAKSENTEFTPRK